MKNGYFPQGFAQRVVTPQVSLKSTATVSQSAIKCALNMCGQSTFLAIARFHYLEKSLLEGFEHCTLKSICSTSVLHFEAPTS